MAVTTASLPDVIYLDHNATTPVAREVLEAMLPYLTQKHAGPDENGISHLLEL